MSFWSNKPLYVGSLEKNKSNNNLYNSKEIYDRNKLLQLLNTELNLSRVQLDYRIINTQNKQLVRKIVDFINSNYETQNNSYKYTQSLFYYFIGDDSLSITFHPKGKRDIIGFISGSKKNIMLYNKNFLQPIEVNFLCLIPQLRNMNVSSYMINTLTKECILYYKESMVCGLYTTGTKLKIPHFCEKQYYFRPFNIKLLTDMNLLNPVYNKPSYDKVYNSFSYIKNMFNNKTLEYYNGNGCDQDMIDYISLILNNSNSNTYDIYDIKSNIDLIKIFNNPSFHIFILKEHDIVTDFVCTFELDIFSKQTKQTCKNGFIYTSFYHFNSLNYKKCLLEYIFKYCKEQNIYDMVTITDLYGLTDKEYYTMKFIKNHCYLYYYMYNVSLYPIPPNKNGLVTI